MLNGQSTDADDWSVLDLTTGEVTILCGVPLQNMSSADANAIAYLLDALCFKEAA